MGDTAKFLDFLVPATEIFASERGTLHYPFKLCISISLKT